MPDIFSSNMYQNTCSTVHGITAWYRFPLSAPKQTLDNPFVGSQVVVLKCMKHIGFVTGILSSSVSLTVIGLVRATEIRNIRQRQQATRFTLSPGRVVICTVHDAGI